MKILLVNPKLLTFILFLFLLLPSCNNEELFVIEQSTIIAEDTEPTEEEEEEEDPNTEDVAPAIDAVDDTFITMQYAPVDLEVHLNDINLPESIALSNTNPSNGILTINTNDTPDNIIDDTVVYTPNAGFSGVDAFDYTICDATNTDNCDTATVTITVEPVDIPADTFDTELKAFPSAYGAGTFTTGGRGGAVIHVTNLHWNDTQGSFKWALEQNYPRTIVFDVSGIITIPVTYSSGSPRSYWNAKGDVTIAGQTAPEGGITIRGESLAFDHEDNVIIRYIKFRKPGSSSRDDWCLNTRYTSNVIVDHCSFAYSEEYALGAGVIGNSVYQTNVTFQNNLFSECKDAILIGESNDDNVSLGDYSILNNVFSNVGWRSPVKIGGALKADVINNAIHNWWYKPIRCDSGDFEVNIIGNYFQAGQQTRNSNESYPSIFRVRTNTTMNPKIWDEDTAWPIYAEGSSNELDLTPDGYPADKSLMWLPFGTSSTAPIKSSWFVNSRLALNGVGIAEPIILASSAVKAFLAPEVGANKYLDAQGVAHTYRDPIDITAIYNFENGVSQNYQTNWDTAAAGLPSMPASSRPAGYDTDEDGMADIWETATFGDLTKASNGDEDGDGYTNIEEFLNQVDK